MKDSNVASKNIKESTLSGLSLKDPRTSDEQYMMRMINFLYFDLNNKSAEAVDFKGQYIGAIKRRLMKGIKMQEEHPRFHRYVKQLLDKNLVKKEAKRQSPGKEEKYYYSITEEGIEVFKEVRELVGKPVHVDYEIKVYKITKILKGFDEMQLDFPIYKDRFG